MLSVSQRNAIVRMNLSDLLFFFLLTDLLILAYIRYNLEQN